MESTINCLNIDIELKQRLIALAVERQQNIQFLILEAVRQYVDKEEKRQRCWADAMHAWQEFKDTGLHATRDEMESWFTQLEAGKNTESPACHK
jgi:predicted transcriptional regulator